MGHRKTGRARGLNQESVLNLGIYCALAGIAGAKVMMIALDPAVRTSLGEIFSLSTLQAAGIFYGGFAAALVMAFYICGAKVCPPSRLPTHLLLAWH